GCNSSLQPIKQWLSDGPTEFSCNVLVLPPTKHATFLNIDGAVQVRSRSAAAGGVMRNENGGWILGYNKFLGNCLILNAELWDILDGLKLIQQRGYNKVVIQLDSLEVVKAMHRSISKISNSALIRRIHHILTQESR
ncbi:hypothetical protein Golob_016203, partial [Gossypium lobatum]|nr:hypothetical protein [Gossypium lobatum]